MRVSELRHLEPRIISIGNHQGILQSILDFDFLAGKSEPSVKAIVSTGKNYQRLFFGDNEVLIPVYPDLNELTDEERREFNYLVNFSSGRRTLSATKDALSMLPNLKAGNLFAEEVPEKHAQQIIAELEKQGKPDLFGPASIGLLIPNQLKLGAIAGVQARQLVRGNTFETGKVAVFSASGGMTNELINIVARNGGSLSFSLAFGGDRFPAFSPEDAFRAAEADPDTEVIVYYGELGGEDEYRVIDLIESGELTKPVVAYIAGSVSEVFEEPPQFGHAKAMAGSKDESARAKRDALAEAGVSVGESFAEFIELVKSELDKLDTIESNSVDKQSIQNRLERIESRSKKLFISNISGEDDSGEVEILGDKLLEFTGENSVGYVLTSILLGEKPKNSLLPNLIESSLKMLVDHGPYQSGIVNTMVTARAGRDLSSALASGILTIGDRFGGALNQAAKNWINAVEIEKNPAKFVEEFASRREYIMGIGHKKYHTDLPDPRVKKIKSFVETLEEQKYLKFALEVEKITTSKKSNLILNVDGALAAALLDVLAETEDYTSRQLRQMAEIEFFNAIFILARSIGMTGHFLDQKRIDEGLFRLSPKEVG